MDFYDSVVESFHFYITGILILLAILLAIHFLIPGLYAFSRDLASKLMEIHRLKSGGFSIKDIGSLSPKEFQYWCTEFLQKKEYTDIQISSLENQSEGYIISTKGKERFYILCKKFTLYKKGKHIIDESTARRLVGIMTAEGFQNGMIITTGNIAASTASYINSLPKPYKIEIYEGKDLVNEPEKVSLRAILSNR